MDSGSAVRTFWRDLRAGLARLNARLAENPLDDDAVFVARPGASEGRDDAERRIAEARSARLREPGVRPPM
ncbi:hypothetical protein DFR50_12063 [Roseiarcus fermentans]|uniref:Uncharacterized protein n=1 Tax=Roseiarcus fermentans TaxID=1473586 RepID=A0A366F5E3_9HYPH|nr:hypothetical protein [Roseiarcus fermentans]RBP09863.1 hypothetical protein DFR50_12063 [Roseiarcus fermentans]